MYPVQIVDASGRVVCEGNCLNDAMLDEVGRADVPQTDLRLLSALPMDVEVEAIVEFAIPAVVRDARPATRMERVEYLRMTAEAGLQFVNAMAEEYGVTIESQRELTPHAVVRGSVSDLMELAGSLDVRSIQVIPEHGAYSEFNGGEARSAVHGGDFHFGYNPGWSGGRAGGRTRIAVIDTDPFACSHPAFREDSNPGSLRIVRLRRCSSSSCSVDNTHVCTSSSSSHATTVAWIAGGDHTDGQNSLITSVSDREAATGVSPESELMFYRIPESFGTSAANATANAIEDAVANGADVIVMSYFIHSASPPPTSELCSTAWNPGNLSVTLKAAVDAGVVIVKSAGNVGDRAGASCQITYPGYRPEVVAVGSVNTPIGTSYQDAVRPSYSSRGLVNIVANDGVSRSFRPLSLLAPGTVEYQPGACGGFVMCSLNPNDPSSGATGTSWSAPAVGGAVASIRDAGMIGSAQWGWLYMVVLKLFGDNYDGNSVASIESNVGPTATGGFGRLSAHTNSAFAMGSLHDLRYTSFDIANGQTAYQGLGSVGDTVPEPSTPHSIKVAFFVPDFDFLNMPVFTVRVEDTCHASGVPTTVLTATSQLVHQGLRLSPSQTSGRCLRLAIQANSVAGSTTTVHLASYRYTTAVNQALH